MSPSEKLWEQARKTQLHFVTWVVIGTAVAHIVGDLIAAYVSISRYAGLYEVAGTSSPNLLTLIAGIVHALSYSVLFFGTAAMVEFLYRIWDELKARKTDKTTPSVTSA